MLAPAAARASVQVSSNWAGHAALPRTGSAFDSVSGTWVVPAATCTAGRETFSAVWVGLGGYAGRARGLEQIGSEQDCARTAQARYGTWLEIVPAAPVALPVRVRPGDVVSASTTISRGVATLRIRDLTSGARYSTTRRIAPVDVSSADWIVEAPSACSPNGGCNTLPLADIATVRFLAATATANGATRSAGSAAWRDETLELRQASVSLAAARGGTEATPTRTVVSATPTAASPTSGGSPSRAAKRAANSPRRRRPSALERRSRMIF